MWMPLACLCPKWMGIWHCLWRMGKKNETSSEANVFVFVFIFASSISSLLWTGEKVGLFQTHGGST